MADTTQQVAVGTNGQGAYVTNSFNTLEQKNMMVLTYTADNVNAAALSPVYLSAGTGDTARKALPAGITLAGDYNGGNANADLQDFLRNNALEVVAIGLQTDNTANYSQQLIVGEQTPNKRNPPETRYDLAAFRQSTGNGYSDTLLMEDGVKGFKKFLTMPNLYLQLNLLKNSYLKVTLYVTRMQVSAPMTDTKF